jgi:hypothetical protein
MRFHFGKKEPSTISPYAMFRLTNPFSRSQLTTSATSAWVGTPRPGKGGIW